MGPRPAARPVRGFLDRQEPVRARVDDATDPERAFADYVRLLTDWRRLPYADPGLPLACCPQTGTEPGRRTCSST